MSIVLIFLSCIKPEIGKENVEAPYKANQDKRKELRNTFRQNEITWRHQCFVLNFRTRTLHPPPPPPRHTHTGTPK